MAKQSKAAEGPKEKKAREKTPASAAAFLIAAGDKRLKVLDDRIKRLTVEMADAIADRTALMSSLDDARNILAAVGQRPAEA